MLSSYNSIKKKTKKTIYNLNNRIKANKNEIIGTI